MISDTTKIAAAINAESACMAVGCNLYIHLKYVSATTLPV